MFLLLVFCLVRPAFSQQYFVRGHVKEKSTGAVLGYTNIRVMNSTSGTAANKNGEYELHLELGEYKLIASCIGFISDTVSITLKKNLSNINFMP